MTDRDTGTIIATMRRLPVVSKCQYKEDAGI